MRYLLFIALALLVSATWAKPTSYRELRYEGVVGQTEWYTCGPAALATLLTEYFGLEHAGELELLELSLQAMEGSGKDVEETGVTALALKQVTEAKGVAAKGFSVTMEELKTYFEGGGLPLVIHVTRPQFHYVLAVGLVKDQIVIADPSYGRRILPFSSLVYEKGFSGIVIATAPSEALTQRAKDVQSETLLWAARRLRRLGNL